MDQKRKWNSHSHINRLISGYKRLVILLNKVLIPNLALVDIKILLLNVGFDQTIKEKLKRLPNVSISLFYSACMLINFVIKHR